MLIHVLERQQPLLKSFKQTLTTETNAVCHIILLPLNVEEVQQQDRAL